MLLSCVRQRHAVVRLYSVFTARSSKISRQWDINKPFHQNQFNSPMVSSSPIFYSTVKPKQPPTEPGDVGLPPEIPEYNEIVFKIKGHDFTVLERFAKYAHALMRTMHLKTECYPMPSKSVQVNSYRPNSTIIDKSYNLDEYERVILVNNLPNPKLITLIYLLSLHTPEGLHFQVDYPCAADEEKRYIPDRQLLELQGQLDDIIIARKKKK